MKKLIIACLAGAIGLGCITGAYIKTINAKDQDTQTGKETDASGKLQKLLDNDNIKESGGPSKTHNNESSLKEDSKDIDNLQDLLNNDTRREYGIPYNTYTYETNEN